MENDQVVQLLLLAVGVIIIFIVVLAFIWIILSAKERKAKKEKEKEKQEITQVKKSQVIYTPESIFDFMNFEKIEDNMIIQKNDKFLMVIECQGINYDLMSEMEKVAVEQGFVSFLNTLRHPIQIYIQTRTINLERSVQGYKEKLANIERRQMSLDIEYEKILKNPNATKNEIEKIKYEAVYC